MQFNVAQLMQEPIGSKRSHILQESIDEIDSELKPLGPLVGDVEILRINSGVLVTAELSTAVQVVCNRCLVPVVMPVRFRVEESFRPLNRSADRTLHPPG